MEIIKFITKSFGILLVAFVGGFSAYVFMSYWCSPQPLLKSDAVSIANTYIVFTTFIFVGFTIIIGVVGFVFAQQFSLMKNTQMKEVVEDICKQSRENVNDIGIKLFNAALENPIVTDHISEVMEKKVEQLIQKRETKEVGANDEVKSLSKELTDPEGDKR